MQGNAIFLTVNKFPSANVCICIKFVSIFILAHLRICLQTSAYFCKLLRTSANSCKISQTCANIWRSLWTYKDRSDRNVHKNMQIFAEVYKQLHMSENICRFLRTFLMFTLGSISRQMYEKSHRSTNILSSKICVLLRNSAKCTVNWFTVCTV